MIDRPIRISLYAPPHSERSAPVTVETTITELIKDLCEPPLTVAEKYDAPGWSPIAYSGNARRASEAVSVCALAYDLDWDGREHLYEPLGAQLHALGWVYAIHASFKPGRARLVLPLPCDLPPRDYARVWQAGARALGIWDDIDQACGDLARMFYAPSQPPGEDRGPGESGGEVLIDPSELGGSNRPQSQISPSPRGESTPPKGETISRPENGSEKFFDLENLRQEILNGGSSHKKELLALLDGTLRIPPGQRELLTHPIISALGFMRNAPPDGVAEALFRRVLAAREGADTQLDEWVEKALGSYTRSRGRKVIDDEGVAATEAFFRSEEWKKGLIQIVGKDGEVRGMKPLEHNILTVFRNDEAWQGHIRWNVLRQRIEVTGGVLDNLHTNAKESIDIPATAWFQTSEYKCHPERGAVGACLQHLALENPYDPVREYFDNLPRWDGVPRIAGALKKYAHADGDPTWINIVSRKFFISGAARPLSPGCQVDTVLVLQGNQGGGKTSFVRTLGAGFHVETSLDLHSKDAVMTATANWLVELGELASLRKADIESVRNFITRKEDQIRLPYGRTVKVMPRRCVFIGTTNARQPLNDPDGNRRYWVVSVGNVEIEALERDRDQLWAEAKEAYLHGEKWWLDPEETKRAMQEAAVYEQDDVLKGEILTWLMNLPDDAWPDYINYQIISQKVLGRPPHSLTPMEVTNINRTLYKFRWKRQRRRIRGAPSYAFTVPKKEIVEQVLAREEEMDNVTIESEAA